MTLSELKEKVAMLEGYSYVDMMKFIKRTFSRKPKLTGHQINMWEHKFWGDRIGWSDFKNRTMNGHMTPKPKVGDIINCEMKSGKIGQFLVINLEHAHGVDDMFFCTVSDFGYTDSVLKD